MNDNFIIIIIFSLRKDIINCFILFLNIMLNNIII